MNTITVEYIENRLRGECVAAPVTIGKIVKVFQNDNAVLHQVLNIFHEGKLGNYHMLPGNGSMEF